MPAKKTVTKKAAAKPAAKKTVTKKPAAKKTPVKKTATQKVATKKSSVKKTPAKRTKAVVAEDRMRMIREAAYFAALNDGHRKSEHEYWVLAEKAIDSLLNV